MYIKFYIFILCGKKVSLHRHFKYKILLDFASAGSCLSNCIWTLMSIMIVDNYSLQPRWRVVDVDWKKIICKYNFCAQNLLQCKKSHMIHKMIKKLKNHIIFGMVTSFFYKLLNTFACFPPHPLLLPFFHDSILRKLHEKLIILFSLISTCAHWYKGQRAETVECY